MTEEEKIINAFNNAWNKKIASENSYGKLASKEMFENKEEIKTEISTDCSYYKDVVKEEIIIDCAFYKGGVCASPINKTCEYCKNIDVSKCYHKQLKRLEQENKELKEENITAQKEYWKLEQGNDFLAEKVRLYRSALEEIKSIVSEQIDITDKDDELMCVFKSIIDKINEVLGC